MVTALQLLKDQLKDAHETFESTFADVTDELLHKDPGGKAFPVGALYAHLVFSEDVIVHSMLQGNAPLYKGEWAGKTGTDSPMPEMDEQWSVNNEQWSKTVHVDLAQVRYYAKAVFAATDAYVATLTDADLEREVDLGAWGKKTVMSLLHSFIIAHTNSLTGEISAIKGVHGAKGYPF